MFINCSNHPSSQWPSAQLREAERYGTVVDLPFPNVEADGDEAYLDALADETMHGIERLAAGDDAVVHVMGEMTLTFALVSRLKARGYRCVASTTRRLVEMQPDGTKVSRFEFVRFRSY